MHGEVDLEVLARDEADVIVVGTGMGGATLGYALARAGKKVWFCEKGRSHLAGGESLFGDYAENFTARPELAGLSSQVLSARSGRWWEEIEDLSAARAHRFVPFIGCGTGGSSALYGMALERFFPEDFAPGRFFPNERQSTIPAAWPISYEDLQDYYLAAEKLYRVRGTPDPLKTECDQSHLLAPPPASPIAEELQAHLRAKGLHPYRLPVGCEFSEGCPCCQSYLCAKGCKNDSASVCLAPALANHGAQLVEQCEVVRLETDRREVHGVVCRVGGRQVVLRSKTVVLAAGALSTPQILLSSHSSDWPQGLANDSGLVGRNLMRHFIDLYAIIPKGRQGKLSSQKEIALNDFYLLGGQKFGTLQSFGALPPVPLLLKGLEEDLRKGVFGFAAPLMTLAKPVMRRVLQRIFSGRVVLASIMEDLPYADNRVELGLPSGTSERAGLRIQYRISAGEKSRIAALRREVAQTLGPYSFMLIKQAENNERIAHACGTCRFGEDPHSSVLDPANRAHGLKNLYVVDASFFPSSGGTNPALTIAANALRVADKIP